ncbi:MAG TPA: FHA domain-containing protein [Gemmata sp.]|jgi:hypothetical protein|nr:FHA domain-containing protein [Gemmata sp.]
MELIAQDTRGIRELKAIRDAIQATTNPVRPPGSPAALVQVFPDGPDLGTLHTLGVGPVVIGRGPELGVSVSDLSVSRAHARLEFLPSGRLAVTDLGSANGTFINDTQVRMGEVCEGDFVRFGGCVFRFLAATPPGQ